MKKTKRPQTPKARNEAYARDMQELRRSNAAQPHKNKARFNKADRNNWKKEI